MFKSNDGIILEDCLFSFIIISTYLLLMSGYLFQLYQLQTDIDQGFEVVSNLKVCILASCEPSLTSSLTTVCDSYQLKQTKKELCVEV